MQIPGYIYITESVNSGKHYIGVSTNLNRRLAEHNSGKTCSTRNKGPWILKFKQKYPTLKRAKQIEYKLKQLKRRDYIKQIIKDKYIKIK